MGLRLAAAATVATSVWVGSAVAAPSRAPNWAAPQIRAVVTRGLMGVSSVSAFRPNDLLTRQALSDLAYGLQMALTPPDPVVPPDGTVDPIVSDPQRTGPTVAAPDATDPTVAETAPADPTATGAASTDSPSTVPAPTTPAPPPAPPKVARPNAVVSLAALDARLVSTLGLSHAAAEFAQGARAAGLRVPARFGTEVVARLLGLRTNHPAAQDYLELRPSDPATRAEAAYSAAQILGLGWLGSSWQTAAVQSLADTFSLPRYTEWQRRILDVAVSKIGMPYVWGGTSDGPEAPFGVHARGGYDCSGFVWRVYKLQSYPGERSLASTLRGRTTYVMSVEVPASQRIPFAQLEPADVIFFGDRGPQSTSAEVDHMGIYLGNGWFIHSSRYGVALAQLTGWYRTHFAWARRPLREAGLSS